MNTKQKAIAEKLLLRIEEASVINYQQELIRNYSEFIQAVAIQMDAETRRMATEKRSQG